GDDLRIETAVDLPHERVQLQPQLLLLNQGLALPLVMVRRQEAGQLGEETCQIATVRHIGDWMQPNLQQPNDLLFHDDRREQQSMIASIGSVTIVPDNFGAAVRRYPQPALALTGDLKNLAVACDPVRNGFQAQRWPVDRMFEIKMPVYRSCPYRAAGDLHC